MQFEQEDLIEDDVFILDGYHEMFVWEGSTASQAEKDNAMKLAEVLKLNIFFYVFRFIYFKKIFTCFVSGLLRSNGRWAPRKGKDNQM